MSIEVKQKESLKLAAVSQDKEYCWHPFTRQSDWCSEGFEPLMIESGDGVWLEDMDGKRYIDGNSSIWTNVHGHNHPVLNQALIDQLGKVAHTSFLGFSHPLAGKLAEKLAGFFEGTSLKRVFYSDDGSTAVECALKMAVQYRLQSGEPERTEFVAFHNGYHGDTLGAASLGGVEAFFSRFRKLGLTVHFVQTLEELKQFEESRLARIAGVIIEPMVQGVNQIHVWPNGMLADLREWSEEQGIHLILDEVMTGFGKTGEMFACMHEGVVADFLCVAKGLTGGYMPMAATLVREEIYEAFLGEADKAFYYGHSYTANPLGCAVALASLEVFEKEETLVGVREKSIYLEQRLNYLDATLPNVHSVRRCGIVCGIELRESDGTPFGPLNKVGEKVCLAAREYQLLTRPILNTVVFMPPLSITRDEIDIAIAAIETAIRDTL